MELYIDSANLKEIKDAIKSGVVTGVTTNPSLVAKEGKDFIEVLQEIDSYFSVIDKKCNCTISAEITELSSKKSMLNQANELVKLSPRIVIKVPMTRNGIEVVKELSQRGIRTNVTLIFSLSQAILAARAGAWCVSPFVGRLDDNGLDGIEVVSDIVLAFEEYNLDTKVLAASIRDVKSVEECINVKSHIATLPPKVFKEMFEHTLTTKGLNAFEKDWDSFLHSSNKDKKREK